MSDIADQSDSTIEQHTRAALAGIPKPPNPRKVEALIECSECGASLSKGRARLGYDICFDCAEEDEQRRRHVANNGHGAY